MQIQQKFKGSGELLRCGDLEYEVIPELHYYNGIPTILKTEEAALVVAEKIFRSLGENEQFFDKDFGPQNDDDYKGSSESMYFTGVQPPGYPDPKETKWLRPEEFNSLTPEFINEGASANDVRQGSIGNCWFISALSVLATRDELLTGRIGNLDLESTINMQKFKANSSHALDFSKGVYPGLFHIYRKKGIYIFRFFKNFQWVYVIIDDRLPCIDNFPVFGTCKDSHETWVPLIEKAYAKLHGSYESLISGFIDDALSELTGYVAEKINLHDKTGKFPNKSIGDPDEFWEFIKKRSGEKCLMGCSRSNAGEAEVIIAGERTGIIAGHAYGLMDAIEISDHLSPGEIFKILRVRNPWGKGEWRGSWSDKSDEILIYKDQLDKYISELNDDDEKFVPGEEDGTFLMTYEDWSSIFNNMYICVDFPENWNGIRYSSRWDISCSGGIPNPLNDQTAIRWAKNPQYCIENRNSQEMEIFVSLAQIDGRGQKKAGEAIKFPFKEVIHPILFSVLHMPFPPGVLNKEGYQRPPLLTRFDEKQVKKMSVLKAHKEVSVRLTVPQGYIYIVPSTAQPGLQGEFILSFYFNQSKSLLHFHRLDKPSENRYGIIKEESENANNVPDWKIELCDKRIKFMIFEEDEGVDETYMASNTINLVNQSAAQKLSVKVLKQGAIKLSSVNTKKLGKSPVKGGMNSPSQVKQKSELSPSQQNDFDAYISQ